jgi:hypothetical protein
MYVCDIHTDCYCFRDVAINLRICTAESTDLHLDAHICEVLLMVKVFAELKHDEGHDRCVLLWPCNIRIGCECS